MTESFRPVTILNEETRTRVPFNVNEPRLAHLIELMKTVDTLPETWGEGVDSAAVMGMTVLFEAIPSKFPVTSILLWLQGTVQGASISVLEATLIKFAKLYI